MIDFLVSRGYRLHDIMEVYPMEMVFLLAKSARDNHRMVVAETVMGLTVAISHCLDLAFAKGKNQVLSNFLKRLFEDEPVLQEEIEEEKKNYITDRAFDFFMSMPKRVQ